MHTPEAGTNRLTPCPSCGRQIVFAAASKLPPNVGTSDFDCFVVVEEEDAPARTYMLGGPADIPIGDSPDCIIRLTEDRGAGRLGVLRRASQEPSRWQIIPAQAQDGTIRGVPLRPAELAHGDTVAWPRARVRYFTHGTPGQSAALSNALTLPALPLGPSILAAVAFLLAIGAGTIRSAIPVPSRDLRFLLSFAMMVLIAPSLWIAALVWGLTRLRTLQANLLWVGVMLTLALAAIVARMTMGIL